ncbi:MAG: dihydroorotase [Calditrichaeota bacterium]|nr:MAG: dihydroorotase [Calditrichota bacterium]
MSLHASVKTVEEILFRNATIVDPETLSEKAGDVLVRNGQLAEIGHISASVCKGPVIELEGRVLCPGLIDMHVHLREPGREDEETVATGCAAAMAGGFTAVCPMPNTEPAMDNAEVVRFVKNCARDFLVDVFPIAAVTRSRAGEKLTEMGDLVQAGSVAFSDDGDPVATAGMMRTALEYASMFGVPIIDHCEEKSLSGNGAMHEGAMSTRLGLEGIPAVAEEIVVSRDIQLAEFTGGRVHIAHISTAGAVEMVRRAKHRGVPVTCEVTPHHFVLTDAALETYDTNFKMNPPLRTQRDVDAVLEGLRDGTIDVIATDHAPHAVEEKEVEFSAAPFGIIGLETALGLCLKHLVEPGVLSLAELVAKLTLNPAGILSLQRGRLAVGHPASLTIFDPSVEWTVDKKKFHSKARNTPFDGWQLSGRVFGLYNRGRWWPAEEQG